MQDLRVGLKLRVHQASINVLIFFGRFRDGKNQVCSITECHTSY